MPRIFPHLIILAELALYIDEGTFHVIEILPHRAPQLADIEILEMQSQVLMSKA